MTKSFSFSLQGLRRDKIVRDVVLFLVWPLFSLLYSAINYRKSAFPLILLFFIVFAGFTFVISSEGIDANFYKDTLVEWNQSDLKWAKFKEGLDEGDIGRGDYLQPTLTYIVSIFTSDYRVLFAFFGLILGLFYSANVKGLIEAGGGRIHMVAFPFLLLFLMVIPFWQINGFRFWTASHVFIFGMLGFSFTRSVSYLIILAASILVHFSFLFPVGLYVAFFLIRRFQKLLPFFFLLSFLLQEINIYGLLAILPGLPATLNARIGDYVHPEYVQQVIENRQELVWFIKYKGLVIDVAIALIIIIVLRFYRRQLRSSGVEPIFYFGMLLFGVTNVLMAFPSIGRFHSISRMLFAASFFVLCQQNYRSTIVKLISILSLAPICFFCIVELRIGLNYLGINTFFLNPLLAPFFDNSIALIDLF